MNDNYRRKLADGDAFADFVAEQFKAFGWVVGIYRSKHEQFNIGESRMGLEIKFDDRLSSTSNVYFEMYEKTDARNPQYVASGILRDDNSILYGIGNRSEFYIFGKRTIVRVYEAFTRGYVPDLVKPDFKPQQTPTSKGFTLKRYLADCYAERIFKADKDGHWRDPRIVSSSFRVDDVLPRVVDSAPSTRT